ncbi:GSCOCG00001011001-RA-CDS [Cotesia congregata]|uniref:Similar to CST9: Chromosome stability protein 9 (Saccharomyces cerevisiae (Strain ATCC 204508 / S288c)) n=1 Tax=Cotesia congregata TaxID=51543 RepID=A0A8J2MJR0_COTCN|nr:GSCOCG00001011001-RA-CDS [Cotesia congregata]CAG5095958.1 Similar to CST9: Chromosome stability protein 9 (Saccharomyces cerevisiae (strain ATCC 204508 / S288c)) [Cotesia congregata]
MSFINHLICNKCYYNKRSGNRPFYLTQCGHIFCHQCISTGTSTCQWCQTPDVQTVELTEPLPPAIVYLFTPRHEFLQNMANVANFQFNQMMISEKLLEQQAEKYNTLKRMFWEQRKTILKIQQMKQKLTTSINELLATQQSHYQPATNSATSDGRYIQPESFFRQDNAVSSNLGHVTQNQRPKYPFGRKVAFVNPSNPYNTVSPCDTYSPLTNINTPRSMNTPITPDTVLYRANYRRAHRSDGGSTTTFSNISSGINLF